MRCLAVAAAHGMHSPYTVGSRDGRTEGGTDGGRERGGWNKAKQNVRSARLIVFETTKREICYRSINSKYLLGSPRWTRETGLGATATNKYTTRLDHPELLYFEFVAWCKHVL